MYLFLITISLFSERTIAKHECYIIAKLAYITAKMALHTVFLRLSCCLQILSSQGGQVKEGTKYFTYIPSERFKVGCERKRSASSSSHRQEPSCRHRGCGVPAWKILGGSLGDALSRLSHRRFWGQKLWVVVGPGSGGTDYPPFLRPSAVWGVGGRQGGGTTMKRLGERNKHGSGASGRRNESSTRSKILRGRMSNTIVQVHMLFAM